MLLKIQLVRYKCAIPFSWEVDKMDEWKYRIVKKDIYFGLFIAIVTIVFVIVTTVFI